MLYYLLHTPKIPTDLVSVKFDTTEIVTADFIKDLGIIFDRKLSFKIHIGEITKQLRSTFAIFLFNSRKFKINKIFEILYSTYVKSKIDYGISVWGNASSTVIRPLIAIQKKFLKLIL